MCDHHIFLARASARKLHNIAYTMLQLFDKDAIHEYAPIEVDVVIRGDQVVWPGSAEAQLVA